MPLPYILLENTPLLWLQWILLNFCFSICAFLYHPLFGFIFLFSWYIVKLLMISFSNDDWKQERRRKSGHSSNTHFLEKTLRPVKVYWLHFPPKRQVCPGIQTRYAQNEYHRSTTCATSSSSVNGKLPFLRICRRFSTRFSIRTDSIDQHYWNFETLKVETDSRWWKNFLGTFWFNCFFHFKINCYYCKIVFLKIIIIYTVNVSDGTCEFWFYSWFYHK